MSRKARIITVAGLALAASLAPSFAVTPAHARELLTDSLSEPASITAPAPARLDPSSRGGTRPVAASSDAAPAPAAHAPSSPTSATPVVPPAAPPPVASPVPAAPATPGAALAAQADRAAVATYVSLTRTPDISTPDKFIAAVAPAAQDSQKTTGVPASVTIAQAILESEWGRSDLSTEAQNYFGIKAFDSPGPAGVISMDTWEVFGGKNVTIDDAFKAYHNLYESVMDHGIFLKDNPRYADAFKTSDPKLFAQRIHNDGYATDPNYCGKLGSLIDKYNLTKYDVKTGK